MELRSVNWPAGWAWLESVLAGGTILALFAALASGVRVQIRRRPRRSRVPVFVRRIIALVGLGLALSASPSPASGRSSAHPGRGERPLPEAPWAGAGGFSPPHPLVPSGSHMAASQTVHPAIHKRGPVRVDVPLFEKADRRRSREPDDSRSLHPAGNPRPVELQRTSSVTVRNGDCLWTIAAETLDSDDPQLIDGYWRAVFRLNHAVIGTDPNHLLAGQVLRLPKEAAG